MFQIDCALTSRWGVGYDRTRFATPSFFGKSGRRGVWGHIMVLVLPVQNSFLPVVPHKAVAEVSKIGHYRRGELL